MVVVRHLLAFSHVHHHFNDLTEMCGPIELYVPDGMLISLNGSFNPVAFRVKYVSIDCETFTCTGLLGHNLGSKSE